MISDFHTVGPCKKAVFACLPTLMNVKIPLPLPLPLPLSSVVRARLHSLASIQTQWRYSVHETEPTSYLARCWQFGRCRELHGASPDTTVTIMGKRPKCDLTMTGMCHLLTIPAIINQRRSSVSVICERRKVGLGMAVVHTKRFCRQRPNGAMP